MSSLTIPVPHSIASRLGFTGDVLVVYDVDPTVLVTDVYRGAERLNLSGDELDDATMAVRDALWVLTPDVVGIIDKADDRNERARDAARPAPRRQSWVSPSAMRRERSIW